MIRIVIFLFLSFLLISQIISGLLVESENHFAFHSHLFLDFLNLLIALFATQNSLTENLNVTLSNSSRMALKSLIVLKFLECNNETFCFFF